MLREGGKEVRPEEGGEASLHLSQGEGDYLVSCGRTI